MDKMVMKHPRLTVDAVIKKDNSVVLIKRKYDPFKGCWAIPGGFIEYGERVEEAVVREAKEETGLEVEIERLVGVYSDPARDPRGHVVSVCFLCKAVGGELAAETDACDVREFKVDELRVLELAFDHRKMLGDAKVV